MASRTRLGLVTALTVASLLFSGGAMNALAKDNGHGKGHGKAAEHAQQARSADNDVVDAPETTTGEARPGLGCGDQNHVHTGPPGNPDKECNDSSDD